MPSTTECDPPSWIVHRSARRGRDHDQVVGKAWPHDGREKVVVEGKSLGIPPVVRNVGALVLRVGDDPAILLGARQQVKTVHPSIVHGQRRGGARVADIK